MPDLNSQLRAKVAATYRLLNPYLMIQIYFHQTAFRHFLPNRSVRAPGKDKWTQFFNWMLHSLMSVYSRLFILLNISLKNCSIWNIFRIFYIGGNSFLARYDNIKHVFLWIWIFSLQCMWVGFRFLLTSHPFTNNFLDNTRCVIRIWRGK